VNVDRTNATAWPLQRNPLLLAFCVSVVLHVLVYESYQLGRRLQWEWPQKVMALLQPSQWLTRKKSSLPQPLQLVTTPKPQVPPQVIPAEPPLVFVSVDPMQAAAAPPKNAKFYSDKNSLAANPDTRQDTGIPKIDGKQNKVPQTLDVPRTPPQPLQPSPKPPPPPAPKETAKAETTELAEAQKPKPSGGTAPGDLAMAKPAAQPKPGADRKTGADGQHEEARPARPRTVAEAKARLQNASLPGQKMRQDGGVKSRLEFSSLDARQTPFGAYDSAIVAAIREQWYNLLEKTPPTQVGRVSLEFRLHADGRIAAMKETVNTVGPVFGWVCQQAVLQPSPSAPWPTDMRRLVGADYREVCFTFYYE
jgi:hypothetical protein